MAIENLDIYPRNNLCFPFFLPFPDFVVDLISQLWFDFTRVSSEQSKETLCSAVNHIDLVQRNRVDDFLPLLYFAFRGLYEFRLQGGQQQQSDGVLLH